MNRFDAVLVEQNGNPNYTYVNDFWRNKYENEASIYWDKFYKKNKTNFFKDRHYLFDEFSEIMESTNKNKNKNKVKNNSENTNKTTINDNNNNNNNNNDINTNINDTTDTNSNNETESKNDQNTIENREISDQNSGKFNKEAESKRRKTFLAIGCGVGNALFPLMEEMKNETYFYAIDLSKRAIEFVQKNENYDEKYCRAYVCDIVQNEFPNEIKLNEINYSLMLFVLSSIHPSHYINVFYKIFQCLKNDGYLFFRDYGRYDLAQLRFKPRAKLSENFYVRDDGTRAYYFTIEELKKLVNDACDLLNKDEFNVKNNLKYEIKILQNLYVKKTCQNKKLGLTMKRIWIQAKFQKILKRS